MTDALQILNNFLLAEYSKEITGEDLKRFYLLEDAEISTSDFSFYTSVSSVYSSKIEGEEMELDSYIKHKKFGVSFIPDYTKKIDDLYDSYSFAKTHRLNKENIFKVHEILSENLISENQRGKLRNVNMYVTTADGRIEYVAATPFIVEQEMNKLFHDLEILILTELTLKEVFFFASLIHLVFIKIHPWYDGNGRTARLIEKWFLAEKLGKQAWFLESEKMYYLNHQSYYINIRKLGLEYETLNYKNALPFLLMLPKTLQKSSSTSFLQ